MLAAAPRPNPSAPIAIGALRPFDRDLILQVHERLGPRSRVQRFLGPKPELSERDLAALTAVDGWDHVALVAFAGPRTPIAVARYVRTEDVGVAETAVEVVDEWQRRGIGRLLIAQLRECALRAGVRRFTWTALESNRAVAALARGLNDRRRVHIGDGVMRWSAAID